MKCQNISNKKSKNTIINYNWPNCCLQTIIYSTKNHLRGGYKCLAT